MDCLVRVLLFVVYYNVDMISLLSVVFLGDMVKIKFPKLSTFITFKDFQTSLIRFSIFLVYDMKDKQMFHIIIFNFKVILIHISIFLVFLI